MIGMRVLQADTSEGPARLTTSKASQIEKVSEIHDLADKIMRTGSACRQDVHRADGLKRIDLMYHLAEIYWASKDIKAMRKPCPYPPSIEVVYAVL